MSSPIVTSIVVLLAMFASLTAPGLVSVARAEDRAARAKRLYEEGEAAYHKGDFETANRQFKEAYLLSKQPALLYDMSSALERLERPHDAAEELRAYLRAAPDETRRASIESRIRALEEAQRILDAELLKRTPPVLQPLPPPQSWWTRRRVAGTVLGIVFGAGAAAAAISVGVVYGTPSYTHSPLGLVRATP